jgi:hypothetical protein
MIRAILLVFLISGCSAYNADSPGFLVLRESSKSVCEVMNEPGRYVGRRILIRGIYFREPHRRLIYDDNCPKLDLSVSRSARESGNRIAERLVRRSFKIKPTGMIPVVYSAVLTSKVIDSRCSKPSCHEYSLQDARLLAAYPPRDMPRRK